MRHTFPGGGGRAAAAGVDAGGLAVVWATLCSAGVGRGDRMRVYRVDTTRSGERRLVDAKQALASEPAEAAARVWTQWASLAPWTAESSAAADCAGAAAGRAGPGVWGVSRAGTAFGAAVSHVTRTARAVVDAVHTHWLATTAPDTPWAAALARVPAAQLPFAANTNRPGLPWAALLSPQSAWAAANRQTAHATVAQVCMCV